MLIFEGGVSPSSTNQFQLKGMRFISAINKNKKIGYVIGNTKKDANVFPKEMILFFFIFYATTQKQLLSGLFRNL